jgi:hypothetical protein
VVTNQYRQWRSLLGSILPLTKDGHCKLVLTVYPHILRELREIESEFSSPLSDKLAVVHIRKKDLPKKIKEKIINFHLNKVTGEKVTLTEKQRKEVVEEIVEKDESGPVFPWCCSYMVDYWHSTPNHAAIFKSPAHAYVAWLKRMLRDKHHGKSFAAVLALTMKGLGGFLHDPDRIQPHLHQLRFDQFSEYHLAEYADVLKNSVLSAEDYGGFYSRVLYDAAGLALAAAFSVPVLLQVCDHKFLVKYVRAFKDGQSALTVHVGEEPNVRKLLFGRVFEGLLEGRQQELCQYCELCSPQFQRDFEAFCASNKKNLQQWVGSVDCDHNMPMLYWSAWSGSDLVSRWCLDIIYR